MSFKEITHYIPSREIEFDNGKILKEFIISENELREIIEKLIEAIPDYSELGYLKQDNTFIKQQLRDKWL